METTPFGIGAICGEPGKDPRVVSLWIFDPTSDSLRLVGRGEMRDGQIIGRAWSAEDGAETQGWCEIIYSDKGEQLSKRCGPEVLPPPY